MGSITTRLEARTAVLAALGAGFIWAGLAVCGCGTRAPAPPPTTSANPKRVGPVEGSVMRPEPHPTADGETLPKQGKPPDTGKGAQPVWGTVVDMGGDDGKPRPQYLSTPPGNPVFSADVLIEEQLAHLKQGNLVYNTPQKMKSSETAHITARIGSDQVSVADLRSSLPGTAGTTTAALATPISARMKMSLKSADFDITPLSSEEQIVAGATPTTWEWDVVPKHAGTLRLHLAATVELNNLSRDFAAIDREVTVQVDPVSAAEDFVGKNVIWVLGGCGTVLAALWGWWKRRKGKAVRHRS